MQSEESIRTNALASCGSLLGVALAAGCSVERPLANAVVDALTAVLLGGTSGSSSTTTAPTRLISETAQAAASLGLAACVGGDWILPSVDRVVANRGLSGANGGREKDAGAATLSAPLVWGGDLNVAAGWEDVGPDPEWFRSKNGQGAQRAEVLGDAGGRQHRA